MQTSHRTTKNTVTHLSLGSSLPRKQTSQRANPSGSSGGTCQSTRSKIDSMSTAIRIAGVLLLIFPTAALADTGFLDRRVTIGSTAYRYQVYVPANFNHSHKWP